MIRDFFNRALGWPLWAIGIAVPAILFLPILALTAAKDGDITPPLAAAWAVLALTLVLYLVDRMVTVLVKRQRCAVSGAPGTG